MIGSEKMNIRYCEWMNVVVVDDEYSEKCTFKA